ncbi:MAG: flagellar biosynthesis protein FlhF [Chitinivibrionia bacterium]|nr:flagellar biosynthesis protein FlhF [Chitinivibrionia bacterium]
MKMKKFTAVTISEAYAKVKAELGEDALILQTRNLPASLVPFYNGDKVEVTAAIDEDNKIAPAPFPQMPVSAKGNNSEFLARLKTVSSQDLDDSQNETPKRNANFANNNESSSSERRIAKTPQQERRQPAQENTAAQTETQKPIQIMKIHDDLNDMKRLLAQILATGESKASGGYAGPWAILYKRLVDSEIKEDFAKELIDKLKISAPNPGKEITKAFLQELANSFPVSACESARIQFFVGPTGAGKTTTIAKLAAYFSLEKKKRCSLITTDTYRISAIDQLRAYSEIIGIDLQAIYSPDEIGDMIDNCKFSDIILVDSAGRSQKNREHMYELESFIRELKPDCTHLVLSATTKESDLIEAANRYRKLGVSRLLFTKLDETIKLGNIFNAVQTTGIPASYFTMGQSVPDDIETAQSTAFVKKLLEGSSI